MMYKTLNQYYRERFGCKVYKLSIDAGFTCPNRDGAVGTGGCIFCSAYGSGDFTPECGQSVTQQLQEARSRVRSKLREENYIAYFQAFTNTYAPTEYLERLYREAMDTPHILGLAIGTRPDCLPPETVTLLERLNREKPVCVELGLQTVHPKTVRYIRRGYDNEVYFDAVRRLKAAGLEVVTHIILGLPGETAEMAAETTRQAVNAGTDGVKFQLLHVLKHTALAADYLAGRFSCLTLEEYAQWLKLCLRELKPETVVHRITGDGAKRDLIAPLWSGNKKQVLNYLSRVLIE